MIAITGASGNLGKATLSFLLQSITPAHIVAVVRDAAKLGEYGSSGIHIRPGDYEDRASLEKSFQGCDTLMQVSSAVYGDQADRQERNVVDAAVAAGIKRIVYVSTLNPGEGKHFRAAITCGATENAIKASGLRYSFFRNSMYMETIPLFIGNALSDGQIFYPGASGRISFVSRIDIAEALAIELLQNRNEDRVFHITGEQAAGFEEIAELLKEKKGLPSTYTDIPEEAFSSVLKESGMQEEEVSFYLSMARSIKADEFALISDDLEHLLGRRRKALKDFTATL